MRTETMKRTLLCDASSAASALAVCAAHCGGSGNVAENAAAGGERRREEPERATGRVCGKGSAGSKPGRKLSSQAKPASVSHRQRAVASHRAS